MAAAGLAMLLCACGDAEPGPPSVILDTTQCAHCRMLVSDLAYPAAFRNRNGEEKVFDEIGCMLRELPAVGARVWVKDYETSEWLEGERAIFLRSASIQTPMGGGVVAFATRERAETYEGEILSLDQLREEKR